MVKDEAHGKGCTTTWRRAGEIRARTSEVITVLSRAKHSLTTNLFIHLLAAAEWPALAASAAAKSLTGGRHGRLLSLPATLQHLDRLGGPQLRLRHAVAQLPPCTRALRTILRPVVSTVVLDGKLIRQFQLQLQASTPRSCRISSSQHLKQTVSPQTDWNLQPQRLGCQILTGRLSAAAESLMAGQFGHVGTWG